MLNYSGLQIVKRVHIRQLQVRIYIMFQALCRGNTFPKREKYNNKDKNSLVQDEFLCIMIRENAGQLGSGGKLTANEKKTGRVYEKDSI